MQSVENMILKEIEQGSRGTTELLSAVAKQRPVTKQAFYKALRELLKEEKITIHGKRVSLSLIWIEQQQRILDRIKNTYGIATKNELLTAE